MKITENQMKLYVDALRRYYGMWLGELKRELTEKDYDESLKF